VVEAEIVTRWFAPTVTATVGAGLLVTGLLLQMRAPAVVPTSFGPVPTAPAAGTLSDGGLRAATGAPVARPTPARPRPGRGAARSAKPASTPPRALWLPDHRKPVPVEAVRSSRSGNLDPPERVAHAGWWSGGAAVGDPTGSVVLVGHVDSPDQGLGAFAALRHLHAGQVVRLRGRDGRPVDYRITSRRTYPRRNPLPASIFATNVQARLVLITCTGAFNGHYTDNLVVYALPVTKN
jgi:sortase family protein